ncbi:MAG: hypothetical protein E7774_05915, partial [Bradyrhizobium sp.]
MDEAFVGVDVGTGSARAGVFASDGHLLGYAKRPIALWREAGDIVEQSTADIWSAVAAAVREALAAAKVAPSSVAGIGFDATCSLVALDANGAPLPAGTSDDPARDVIAWMDHRAVEEAGDINRGGHEALRWIGGSVSPEMQTPKLLWLARHAPSVFARARHFFDLTDFLTFRATGSAARSLCTVACKWNYLAHEGRWPLEFFDGVGLGALVRPGLARIGAEIVAPGVALGAGLCAAAAEAFGLPIGVPVGAGLIDAHAGALATLGASLGEEADPRRRIALVLGTSACCMALSDTARFVPRAWGPHYSALTPGQWLVEGGQSAFGAAIDWLTTIVPSYVDPLRGGLDFARLERELVARAGGASAAALLARDLHVLPDFLGNRTPYADPAMRGAIVGLDLRDDRESALALYAAVLSGLALGLDEIIRSLEAGGYGCDMLIASGGAAGSDLVRQIISDVTGKPIATPETSEPVLLGAAMLGATAAGRCSITQAMGTMSRLNIANRPAGGEIAALHARKRLAFETLRHAERRVREVMHSDEAGGAIGLAAPRPRRKIAWPALIIFDCDGVLVDSETIALARTRAALERYGLSLSLEETGERFLGVSAQSMQGMAERDLGVALP